MPKKISVGDGAIDRAAATGELPHKLRLDAIDIDSFDVLAANAASALLLTRLYAASDGIAGATA